MPLEEAMRTQRAIRRLKPDPVDDSLVLHLLELAMKAPTGSNAQNWEFIVVKDREVVAKLGRLTRTAWTVFGPIYQRAVQRRGDEKMLRTLKAVRWQVDHFDDIPVVVVACLRGCRCALAADRCEQRLWLHLSRDTEPAAGGARGWAGRGADHHAVVEHAVGQARPGPAAQCHSVRGNSPWLADGQIRSHDASAGGRTRFARPIRQPSVSVAAAM